MAATFSDSGNLQGKQINKRFGYSAARLLALLILALGTLSLSFVSSAANEYDIVIRNGRVLDGSGNPWFKADIGIKDKKIVEVGKIQKSGKKEIDAAGLYVSPGWIDSMDQSGSTFLESGRAENKLRMGVTTVVAGEGGFPVSAEKIPSYFKDLETSKIGVNFASYYSATQARVAVMGDVQGAPTEVQLAAMNELVATAMKNGALGITTALIYPPSAFHTTDELIAMSRIAAEYDGIYASHIRDESEELLSAVEEAIQIGEESGIPVEIFHLKAAYQPGWGTLMKDAGQVIDDARQRGVDIAVDVYPYTAGGTGLEATAPSWIFKEGSEKGFKILADPKMRAQLKKETLAGLEGWQSLVRASGGWENVVLANANSDEYEQFNGMNLVTVGEELDRDPADAAWDITLSALPKRAYALFFMMSEDDVARAISYPWASIGSDAGSAKEGSLSDDLGLPHPRSYGTFPRIIAKYVREDSVLTLPDAIRKMTSWPASRLGLDGRGLIRKGMWADIVIFDLESLQDRADWENPTLYPEGITNVLVNGEIAIDGEDYRKVLAGQVIRAGGFQSN